MALYPDTPFSEGDAWTPDLAYLAFHQIFDDQPQYLGHHRRIIDDELSNDPSAIKPRFNAIEKALQVSKVAGLTLAYNAGSVILPDGTSFAVAAGQLVAPDNKTSYVYVDTDGTVKISDNPPVLLMRLAKVITSGGAISQVVDLRSLAVKYIMPRVSSIKVFGGSNVTDKECTNGETFDQGLYYYRNFTVPAGVTITIDKWAKIYCSGYVRIDGTVNVTPFAPGASSYGTPVNGYGAFGGVAGHGAGSASATGAGSNNWTFTYGYGGQAYGSGGTGGYVIGSPVGSTSNTGLMVTAPGGEGGGGFWVEAALDIVVNGGIFANGNKGGSPKVVSGYGNGSGGGGGSGGLVLLSSLSKVVVSPSATVSVKGGAGGDGYAQLASGDYNSGAGGGGGGGGYVVLISPDNNVSGANILLSGGVTGQAAGSYTKNLGGGFGAGFGGAGSRVDGTPGQNGKLILRPFIPIGS
ncbi:hypothetical protein ACE1B6_24170 [Aerosakkonemataceae cyanobacterium BLCC-F154]|uniref:Uncharacterized protein n=1 Tax=Floridaenema fluviatile BLCC-F154 TaxID=3153640 RepID=A0ABV4YKJ2_9CYAN